MRWSRQVKIKNGWVCRDCGELDKELLESNHIIPRAIAPELANDIRVGRCRCLWCHAYRHRRHPRIRDMILARLAIILYHRHYRNQYDKRPL